MQFIKAGGFTVLLSFIDTKYVPLDDDAILVVHTSNLLFEYESIEDNIPNISPHLLNVVESRGKLESLQLIGWEFSGNKYFIGP